MVSLKEAEICDLVAGRISERAFIGFPITRSPPPLRTKVSINRESSAEKERFFSLINTKMRVLFKLSPKSEIFLPLKKCLPFFRRNSDFQ